MRTQYRPSPGRWGRWQEREAQKKVWAHAERVRLIRELGGRCVGLPELGIKCSERRISKLELDHKDGRTWSPRKTSQSQRVVLYRREAAQGLLQVLCRSCNAIKGNRVEKLLAAAARRAALAAARAAEEPSWITEPCGGTETDLEPF